MKIKNSYSRLKICFQVKAGGTTIINTVLKSELTDEVNFFLYDMGAIYERRYQCRNDYSSTMFSKADLENFPRVCCVGGHYFVRGKIANVLGSLTFDFSCTVLCCENLNSCGLLGS